jgi:hypothetical protein
VRKDLYDVLAGLWKKVFRTNGVGLMASSPFAQTRLIDETRLSFQIVDAFGIPASRALAICSGVKTIDELYGKIAREEAIAQM